MLWSPTIRAALIAGTPRLDVFCPGCGTSRAIDLRKVDRHPIASVATLVLGLRCSWCRNRRRCRGSSVCTPYRPRQRRRRRTCELGCRPPPVWPSPIAPCLQGQSERSRLELRERDSGPRGSDHAGYAGQAIAGRIPRCPGDAVLPLPRLRVDGGQRSFADCVAQADRSRPAPACAHGRRTRTLTRRWLLVGRRFVQRGLPSAPTSVMARTYGRSLGTQTMTS
jgi:hypothetical protein